MQSISWQSNFRRGVILCIFALSALCGGNAIAQERLVVFAAASLKDPLDMLRQDLSEQVDVDLRVSYASSGTLARQVLQGAPADVVLVAHPQWMTQLQEEAAVRAETVQTIASNQLVLLGPKALEAGKLSAKQLEIWLGEGGRLALGNPDFVPAGLYAQQAFEALSLWPFVKSRSVFVDHARAALVFAQRQEARLAVVYQSDVAHAPSLKVLADIPSKYHDPVVYLGAVSAAAQTRGRDELSRAFMSYLISKQGQMVFEHAGFSAIDE